jgi:hypothetical protein
MPSTLFGPGDVVAERSRMADRAAQRTAAIAEDSARLRAAYAAGSDRRAVGVTRRAVRDDADEMRLRRP